MKTRPALRATLDRGRVGEPKARTITLIFLGFSISSEACMATSMYSILIVDDHALFRDALREFLSQKPEFQIVGEAGSVRDAVRCVRALSPHLVLTDLAMPDAHGVEAVTGLKRHFPDLKILVISLHRENEFKQWCRRAGASGYIVKDAIHDELCDAIRAVLSGKTYMGADAPYEIVVPDYGVGTAVTREDHRCILH
jgi:CheY-like chemotaxis protein